MGLLNVASAVSAWMGYTYYKRGNVLAKAQLSDTEFEGMVQGSNDEPYEVFINVEHPRKSRCNCPHANGKRIVCKHQIALYFSAFPKEAEKYYQDVLEYEREEAYRREELDKKVIAYIKSLSKEELRQTLYEVLYDGTDWMFERFVREHIDY